MVFVIISMTIPLKPNWHRDSSHAGSTKSNRISTHFRFNVAASPIHLSIGWWRRAGSDSIAVTFTSLAWHGKNPRPTRRASRWMYGVTRLLVRIKGYKWNVLVDSPLPAHGIRISEKAHGEGLNKTVNTRMTQNYWQDHAFSSGQLPFLGYMISFGFCRYILLLHTPHSISSGSQHWDP